MTSTKVVDVVVLDSDGEVDKVEKATIVEKSRVVSKKKKKIRIVYRKKKKPSVCPHCGKCPCEWTIYSRKIISEGNRKNGGMQLGVARNKNKERRFDLYQYFTFLKFGTLGRFNRKELPWCVEGRIKDMYPERDGNYTFFQPVAL